MDWDSIYAFGFEKNIVTNFHKTWDTDSSYDMDDINVVESS